MNRGVLAAYSGYLKDEALLVQSASGGFGYAIARKAIEAGGVVFSVRYSPDFRTGQWARAAELSDLAAFRGSKYVESEKVYDGFNLYEAVKSDLESEREALVIGLPCDIGAIKAYLKRDAQNLTCVDLICHGPTSKRIADEYLTDLEKKYRSSIVDFTVRYKKNGLWTPPYLRAVFSDGRVYEKPFYSTDYGRAFAICSLPRCYACNFKGEKHASDLTIGDFWGLTPENKREWNAKGSSIAFVRTERGQALIEGIKDICNVFETDMDFAMEHNTLLNEQKRKHPRYDAFIANLDKKGLHTAARKSRTLKDCLRGAAGIAARTLLPQKPQKAYEGLKRVYSRLRAKS